jgi:predicted SAM-dependent methyltransferase
VIQINLCSGQRPFAKPWINVDVNSRWNPDVEADGSSMPMFPDGTAEMIVIHQGLEHFGCGEASAMLKECYRILAPEGSLIVSVPDMLKLAKMWLRGELTTQVYMTNVYGAYMDSIADRHMWGFDPLSLTDYLLATCPWKRVASFDWRKIEGADIARDDRWILALECWK